MAGTDANLRARYRIRRIVALAAVVAVLAAGTGCAAVETTDRPPVTGPLLRDQDSDLSRAVARYPGLTTAERSALSQIARRPLATWLTRSTAESTATIRRLKKSAFDRGETPTFVLYRLPGRDCGGASGLPGDVSASSYREWVRSIVAGLGRWRALVIVEPDALAQLDCLDASGRSERISLLRYAVDALRRQGSSVYLDAGHAGWIAASTMADRLRRAGAGGRVGFSLNVSSFGSTATEIAYGRRISRALGDAHFVIDTSRNGAPAVEGWCNPADARLGRDPTTRTGASGVDAFLWVKTPGFSDGPCDGAPPAGALWPTGAVRLASDGAR